MSRSSERRSTFLRPWMDTGKRRSRIVRLQSQLRTTSRARICIPRSPASTHPADRQVILLSNRDGECLLRVRSGPWTTIFDCCAIFVRCATTGTYDEYYAMYYEYCCSSLSSTRNRNATNEDRKDGVVSVCEKSPKARI